MKQVRVKLFAAFRDAEGTGELTCRTGAADVAALFSELCSAHPGLRPEAAALVAVNDAMVAWDSALEDGDEVLYFPPVAGG